MVSLIRRIYERKGTIFKIITRQFKNKLNHPDHLIIYVTGKCGARCKHCFYGDEINQKDPVSGKFFELSFEEIEKISKSLKKLSGVTFTGGDPFLRTDLAKIAKLFYDNNKPEAIHIPTNGLPIIQVKNTTTEILQTCNCDLTIAMSIDTLHEKYDVFRGVKGNFNRMLEMYDMLAELKNKYGAKLHLVVNSVITNMTHNDIPELINFIKERMPLVELHDFDLVRGSPYDNSIMLPSFNDLIKLRSVLHKNYEYYSKKNASAALKKFQYDLNLETIQKKTQVLPCVAGETYIVISEKGEVYFCELRESIGNIRNNNVQEIWNSEKAEKLRASIKRKDCFCTHGCFQPLNILYNLSSYPKLFKYLWSNPYPDIHHIDDQKIMKVNFDSLTNIGDQPKFWSNESQQQINTK